MQARFIIAAAEELRPRWNNCMGITRHLIPAEGEPLIHRIQRQLQTRGARDVIVLCAPERVPAYCRSGMAKHSVPPLRTGDIRENSVLWTYRNHLAPESVTVFLFADTYYTDELMDRIFDDLNKGFRVYGSATRPNTGAMVFETFAILMTPAWVDRYLETVDKVAAWFSPRNGNPTPNGAMLTNLVYNKLLGVYVNKVPKDCEHWVEWVDMTTDFDSPNTWYEAHRRYPDIFTKPTPP